MQYNAATHFVTFLIHKLTTLFLNVVYCSPCRWLKDSKPVRQGEGVRILANGHRLVISRAQVSDSALFQCVATNEAGEQERDFKVAVHGKKRGCSTEMSLMILKTVRSEGARLNV